MGSSGRAVAGEEALEFLNHEMLKTGRKQIRWDSGGNQSRFRHSHESGWCGGAISIAGAQTAERDDCT